MRNNSMKPAICMFLAAWIRAAAASAGAQCPPDTLLATLNNPAPAANDDFGYSVAVSGNTAVVGARWDDPGGVHEAGTAYAFDATTGALTATLANPAPTAGDEFGASVAVSGNTAVVGAPGNGPTTAGIAYVFDATTGIVVATLYNPAPTQFDYFGWSVAVSGSTAVVGAYRDDPGFLEGAGRAYVFDATTGILVATLSNPAPAEFDNFGWSVAVSGNTAVVGAPNDEPGGAGNAGTAYVFDATTGALVATLNNPDPAMSDRFGASVAVSGNIAVVGAEADDPGAVINAGTAYVFNAMSGALLATLSNPAPAMSDRFGWSVAVSGNTAVVGSYRDDPGGVTNAGTTYVFDAATGALLATLDNPAPAASDQFGGSVAVSGDTAVVGANLDAPGGVSSAGTAYVFTCADLVPTPTPDPTVTPSPDPTASPTPAATAAASPTSPGVSPTASATPAPCCLGDADNSGGSVNANDFLAVQASFGANNGLGGLGDADCSGGAVNANDFLAVQANFGASCG